METSPSAPDSQPIESGEIQAFLQALPEEEFWLANQNSERTRRAYRNDVAIFVEAFGITTPEQLRQVSHREIIAWKNRMEAQNLKATTIRRRLSALSSLFRHLINQNLAVLNPVSDVKRPAVNEETGTTPAFSQLEARQLLDAPDPQTLIGFRDRAILGVGFYAGL